MSITVELPDSLTAELKQCAARAGQTPAAFIEEAIRSRLAVAQFEERRRRLHAHGQQAGFHTDEEVFAAIS